MLLIIPSLLLRYRASRGLIRQQLKLFVWGFVLLVGVFIVELPFFNEGAAIAAARSGPFAPLLITYEAVLFPAAPFVVVGYAILRHKLYDIDIIIRRTAIYSVVTAILGSVYFGIVTLLQSLFSTLTTERSPLAVVVSTLTIAMLFNPLRSRVQQMVDRVFYRGKYDAQQTLAQFGAAMQSETDIEGVETALLQAVDETLQPVTVGLWMPEGRKP